MYRKKFCFSITFLNFKNFKFDVSIFQFLFLFFNFNNPLIFLLNSVKIFKLSNFFLKKNQRFKCEYFYKLR
jgi:hypothetical protein